MGLKAGDLIGGILNEITFDEYESKIDDKAFVIGFYANDIDAANDLNRFLQKTAEDILDTDVSPAPDQKGRYLVFVEAMGDETFPGIFEGILKDLHPLVDIAPNEWKISTRQSDKPVTFSKKTIEEYVKKNISKNVDKKKDDSKKGDAIKEFLSHSYTNGILLEGDFVKFSAAKRVNESTYKIECFDQTNVVMEMFNTGEKLKLKEVFRSQRLHAILGEGWNVIDIGSNLILVREDSTMALCLKPVSNLY